MCESSLFDLLPMMPTFDTLCDDLHKSEKRVRRAMQRIDDRRTFSDFARFTWRWFARLHLFTGQGEKFEAELFCSIILNFTNAHVHQRNDSTRCIDFLVNDG